MEWRFDNNGYVTPYACIPISLEDFKKFFVDDIGTTRRVEIFDQYEKFFKSVGECLDATSFYQWLDGSFVTLNAIPNDLDIVTFIPNKDFSSIQLKLKELQDDRKRFSLLDIYFVTVFAKDHKSFFLYQSDELYWHHLFRYSKRNLATGKRFEKGFFQINFDK